MFVCVSGMEKKTQDETRAPYAHLAGLLGSTSWGGSVGVI